MLGSARGVLMKPGTAPAFPSPIAAYGFSEGSGTTTADSSGNAHTMTLNGTSWDPSGHTGSALTNTTTALGATAAFVAPTATLTLMAWIKPLDLTAGTTHFALGFVDSGGNTDVAIFTERADFGTSNVLQADIRIAGNLTAVNGSALTVGTWAHVAITFDGTTARLYKDGSLINSVTNGGTVSPGNAFYVAGWNAVSPYDTDVVVDDVRVFNTALTLAQVSAAMTTPVS